jgi:hypothetical protein
MADDDDHPKLGTCCACGGSEHVRNIIMLDRRGPTPGKGWGCVECGLPCDGAIAVLCDPCFDAAREPVFAVVGYPKDNARMPLADLPVEPFEHDPEMHRDEWGHTGGKQS